MKHWHCNSYFKRFFKSAVFTLFLTVQACAPGLSRTLKVDYIPPGEKIRIPAADRIEAELKLGEFSDARTDMVVATIDGRDLEGKGDLVGALRLAFSREAKLRGINVVYENAPAVNLKVTKLYAEVSPAFPASTVESESELQLEVKDSTGQNMYRGTYGGSSSFKHPFLNQDKVEEAIGLSLREAIQAALQDTELLGVLYRGG